MKANINGLEVECSVEEFRKLICEDYKPTMPSVNKSLTIFTKKKMHRNSWNPQEVSMLKAWYKAGKSIKRLARILGRTRGAIYTQAKTMRKNGDLQ